MSGLWPLVRAAPRHALSRAAGRLGRCPAPRWILTPVLAAYARAYGADLGEAERPIGAYATFLDFFTRRLKPGARPLPEDPRAIASPADGRVQAAGRIHAGTLLQAKGVRYRVADLLGDAGAAAALAGGEYLVVYLAPGDYHRFHWPLDGTFDVLIHLPGDLWPVNERAVDAVPGLFARNERVVLLGRTAHGAPFAFVAIGALNVGSIRLAVAPVRTNRVECGRPRRRRLTGARGRRGDELGWFEFGSSLALLLGPGAGTLLPFAAGTRLRAGQPVGVQETGISTAALPPSASCT